MKKHARPEDIEVNKLGMVTYRVHVHETEKSKIEEDVRSELKKIIKERTKDNHHERSLEHGRDGAEAAVDEQRRSR